MHNRPQPRILPLPSKRLADMGISLASPARPVAAYVPCSRTGDLLYVSGQIPLLDGKLLAQGVIPGQVSVEEAEACARRCAVNGLAAVHAHLANEGGIDAVTRVVRVGCWVACEPGFVDHPRIANAASELLIEVFGDFGRHARAAVGSISLPLNSPVEIEFLFEIARQRDGD